MADPFTILSLVLSTGITSAILQVVVGKLADHISNNIRRSDEVSGELQQLDRGLRNIISLVEELENKQTNACAGLIEDIKNAVLDAEDLLDKIDLSRLKSNDKHELSGLLKRVDGLVEGVKVYFLSEINRQLRPQSSEVNPGTSSFVDKQSVFGRGNEKQEMVKMLLEERGERVSVIPIVGMGGTGKTTLAQLVYHDEAVVDKFKLRMWVYFPSLDSDLVTVTKSIYESATKEVLKLSNLDAVQVALQNKVQKQKFLLVLDGMWNEDQDFWEKLKLPFNFAVAGSNIVVTTRSKIVSSIVSTGRHYHLHTFSGGAGHEACWEIIKHTLGGNLDGHEDLQNVGLEIAKKCKGLPLAAKAIGRALRLNLKKEWDHILNCEPWDFPEDYMRQIYPVLKVSYDHLPPYLKRCFAYCSIFPHKFQFEEDDLIQLWAAEGFIQPQNSRSIEGIGRKYFDFLLSGSLFQVSSNAAGGRKYEMHDFNHDLARLVSTNLCFRLEDSMSTVLPPSGNVRHSSLLCQDVKPSTLKQFHRYEKLRTFILLPRDPTSLSEVPYDFFSKLPCLRVLNLSRSQITKLPESIGKLMHLRYLNLNETLIRRLPKSLADICRLEILKLKNCYKLHELPEDLENLSKLRQLDFDRTKQIRWPKNLGKLTLLETLPEFIVGKDKGCKIEELKNMTCLRGSLSIKNLENVADVAEAKGAILHNKQYLESLELHWNDGTRDAAVEQAVLEGLKPHDRLKRLQVVGYMGSKFPDWIGQSSFCELESIHLEMCQLCELPSLGQLPVLKELVIEKMDTLKEVRQFCGSAGYSFPSLKMLNFFEMPELSIWSGINGTDMPCLTELRIDSCPNLDSLPALSHLTSLETLDIDWCPKLRSIPGEALPCSLKHLSISSQLCTGLPSLGQLPFLKELVIGKMGTLTNVDPQFCRLAGSFPSLETLTFCDMPESSIQLGVNQLDMPRLIELRIDYCPNLVSLSSVHHLTSLKTLDINGCSKLPSPGEGLPRSLAHLSISGSDSLKEWCKGRDGDDWSKILQVVVDGVEIPMDGRGN